MTRIEIRVRLGCALIQAGVPLKELLTHVDYLEEQLDGPTEFKTMDELEAAEAARRERVVQAEKRLRESGRLD